MNREQWQAKLNARAGPGQRTPAGRAAAEPRRVTPDRRSAETPPADAGKVGKEAENCCEWAIYHKDDKLKEG